MAVDVDMERLRAVFGRDPVRIPDDIVLFTKAEVANWFGVSRSLIDKEIARGRIGVLRLGIGLGSVRVSLTEVKRYLRDRSARGLMAKGKRSNG